MPPLKRSFGLLHLLPPQFLLPVRPHRTVRFIRSITRPKTNRYNNVKGLPALDSSQSAALKRKTPFLPLRTGALAIKKGMTGMYDSKTGKRMPCTVLQFDQVQVVSHKTVKPHGYWAVQVGAGTKREKNVTRPMLGHFAAQGVSPKRHMAEFRVKDRAGLLEVGEQIEPSWFKVGQFVDARADCKGKGFAGVMKKHGMSGQPASHGVSLTHRAMGSAGPSQGGGSRVHPGKRMAGRMGGQRNTVQNLQVLQVDDEHGVLVVKGCISGPNKGIVMVQDAIKKPWPDLLGTQAAIDKLSKQTLITEAGHGTSQAVAAEA
ncbi:MAG: 54S ribosomal protein L9, mitochondrial [Vezdaea aestivalis]|nr:MAG: 54S ribosomal protein L9, mitochondrial [Vezdaea aestivalis]